MYLKVEVMKSISVKINPKNLKKCEHGIGAVVERNFRNITQKNSDASKVQTVTFTTTINIRKNQFGEQFAINYGTQESRGQAVASWTLDGILMFVAPESQTNRIVIWVYTGVQKLLPVMLWFTDGYKAFSIRYKTHNLYQSGGKIEDKLKITTTTYKNGHGLEKIKGTYSVWGRSSHPTVICYQNKENVF
jgi:hypothetical protein